MAGKSRGKNGRVLFHHALAAQKGSLNFVKLTNLYHLNAKQFAELVNFVSHMPDANGAMVCRAMRVPIVHKFSRAG
jgi:hypothetical protein